jgi:NADPH:quinone reductase-like Zn-dependent oxidoreductase
MTNRRGVDVVLEHVGEATWAKCVQSPARGGRLVTCGATTGSSGSLNLNALFSKQLTIRGRLEESHHSGKIVLEVP